MHRIVVIAILGLVVATVFLLSLLWETTLEDLVLPIFVADFELESHKERIEYTVTATAFAALALLLPGYLLVRAHERLIRLNNQLESRVDQRTQALDREHAERLGVEHALGNEVAERRQAEMMNIRLGRIVENVLDEVYVIDADTLRFVQVNRRAREKLGRHLQRLDTVKSTDVLPFWTPMGLEEKLRVLRHGAADHVVFDVAHQREDGGRCDFEVRLQYMSAETPPLLVAFVQDITERKDFERALIEARESAEAANKEKSLFLARMSHEMRTPLNGMLGLSELLLLSDLSEDQRELAQKGHEAGRLLLDMIGALLDQSKIEAGKLDSEVIVFNLRTTVQYLVELLAERAKNKGLVIRTVLPDEIPTTVSGDLRCFRQILLNLVSNAIKFTDVGEIGVTCSVAERSADGIVLHTAVHDTGVGIAPELQDRIFDPFVQADDSTTRRHDGIGLGLAIARQLALAAGGEIGVVSDRGEGSTFHFSMPLTVPVADTGPGAPEGRTATRPAPAVTFKARVLVAEDNPVSALATKEMLKLLGCEVTVAVTGKQAVEAFAHGPFDLVLMDCWMPEMDGFEATAAIRLREREAGPSVHTPIIANTAHAMQADREQCLAAGMDGWLAKPVSLAKLQAVLQSWLIDRPCSPLTLD